MKAKKLPSGNYRAQAFKNGQRRSFTADTKRAAEMAALEWQQGDRNEADKTLLTYLDKYILSKSAVLSPNTVYNYNMMKDNYYNNIINLPVSRITDEQIQITINALAKNHSPKTVKNAYGLLTAVFRMFRPDYHPKITLPQRVKTEIVIPTHEQMQTLLRFTQDKNIYIPITLAAFCGLREGEICALTSDDIIDDKLRINKSWVWDDSQKEWQIKPPKSFSGDRYVDIPPQVKNRIEGKIGRIVNYTPDGLRMVFKKAVKKLDMPHIRFHDLRHFYVSELFDMGLPEKYIIAQVGHSSASITKRVYDHLSQNKQSTYSSQIAAHFATIL